MAIGQNGRAVRTSALVHPTEFASRVGAHIHKGDADSTVGGPGATEAPGASLEGASAASPYGGGGDTDGN